MGGKDFERDRQDFIESSSKTYYPYSWELDGHPAMRRPSLRRLRHTWKWTQTDWIKSIVFLVGIFGLFFLLIGLWWLLQAR